MSDEEPIWLSRQDLEFYHDVMIAKFGGSSGVRDEGLLESSVPSPRQTFSYENPDLFTLAGRYAFSLSRNHPFVDGNKRVAFVAASVFLEINGFRLEAPEHEAVVMVEELASGGLEEDLFSSWLRKHSVSTEQ